MGRQILLWSAVVAFPLPLVVLLNAQLTDEPQVRFFITLGLISYSWWLLAVLLSLRLPWLDRHVGLPSLYALHGALGVIALVPAYFHRHNTFAPNVLALNLGQWSFYTAIGLLCYSVFFLSGWLSDRSRLLLTAKRFLERTFRHQLSMWIHRLNLVVVVMIWLHVHVIDRVSQHFAFMMLFDAYTLAVLGAYAWKKMVAPDSYVVGSVSGNVALNESTRRVEIVLAGRRPETRPGDFFFLKFEGRGLSGEWHPFSVTDDRQGLLAFTIRQVGDFTGNVGQARIGTQVRLEGPFGRFDSILRSQPDPAPLVFIGMGAGVAPLLSLATAHLPHRRIHLLWAVRHQHDAYYSETIEDYRRQHPQQFTVTSQVGRFHADALPRILSAEEIADAQFFVAGPNPAVLTTQRNLVRCGVSARRVHHERMTL